MSPSLLSPGISVIEKDVSDFAPSINSSVVGIVGFASKGPVNDATLITSQQQLIDTFGKPSEGLAGQGLEGALEILEATNSIYFVRGSTSTSVEASALVPFGLCPAVSVLASGYGLSATATFRIQVYNNAGTAKYASPKVFTVAASTINPLVEGNTQYVALRQVMGGSLDADKFGIFTDSTGASSFIVGSYAGSGASIAVSAYTTAALTTPLACLGDVTVSSGNVPSYGSTAVRSYGASLDYTGASGLAYFVQSLYPGAGYNGGTNSAGATSGNSVEIDALGNSKFLLTVNQDGTSLEEYKAEVLGDATFIEEVINTGTDNAVSEVIQGYLTSGAADFTPTPLSIFADRLSSLGVSIVRGTVGGITPTTGNMVSGRFVKPLEGTYSLSGGDNGISTDDDTNATALIGDSTTNPKTGIYALDNDQLNISIALTPGMSNQSLQNALITLAEETQNFIALVSPPYGTIDTAQEAIDWSNGQSESRTASLNSSYAAAFFPWVQVYNTFDGINTWYDPVIFAARQMVYTDSISDPWFAPAGFQRGRLTKPIDVDVNLNQGDRDSLYSGGNIINPIVNFPQKGITIFGQRTTQRAATALDRINIRRLMIYLRKLVLASTQQFIFEPNDPILWEQVQNVMDPALDDIRRRRGITDYRVICDETTNTPARIDRNEMWAKIIIKPTKTAEVIVFELNLTSQTAQLG